MSKDWYFGVGDDGKTIAMIARAEGPGGLIGDCFREVGPGEAVDGVPHDELLAAGGGVLKVHDGGHEIVKPRRRKPGTAREAAPAAKAGQIGRSPMADELFDQVIADAARKREARREARRAYDRAYREKNREAKLAYARAYREAHPDYERAYREKNREARLAYAREWYRKNREAKRARDRAWREAHPDYERERYRKARAQGEAAADRDAQKSS
jgi:hypothetical protein